MLRVQYVQLIYRTGFYFVLFRSLGTVLWNVCCSLTFAARRHKKISRSSFQTERVISGSGFSAAVIFRLRVTFGSAASDVTTTGNVVISFRVCLTHTIRCDTKLRTHLNLGVEQSASRAAHTQTDTGWTRRGSIRIFTVDTLSKLQFYMDIKSIHTRERTPYVHVRPFYLVPHIRARLLTLQTDIQ